MNLRPTLRLALPLAFALAGCAGLVPPGSDIRITSYQGSDRWLNASFYIVEHPFTDDGAARAQAKADQLCGESRRVAVQSERACSLEKCTTQFVCMKAEDAQAAGRPAPPPAAR